MKIEYVKSKPSKIVWKGSFELAPPTEEEREEMRRLAESYDEEEHRRVIEAARPSITLE